MVDPGTAIQAIAALVRSGTAIDSKVAEMARENGISKQEEYQLLWNKAAKLGDKAVQIALDDSATGVGIIILREAMWTPLGLPGQAYQLWRSRSRRR